MSLTSLKKKTREDVEVAVSKLESSTSEKHLDPSAVSRGSSLDRDDNGLLTLAGGKITDYRKMAEGAMERVVEILKAEFDRSFKLINSKTYPVSGGELTQQMWTQKSKPLRNLECHVVWIARKLIT